METLTQTAVPATLTQVKPAFSLLLSPVTSNEEILKAWHVFNDLKTKLLNDNDFVTIQGKQYPVKTAYRKLGLAFGISTELIQEKRLDLKDYFMYEVTIKAISPNGRFMTCVASCASNEKKFNRDADVRAIAQTRATNRAISDLLGGVLGVSAEEIITESEQRNGSVRYELKPAPQALSYQSEAVQPKTKVDDGEINNGYLDILFREKDEEENETKHQNYADENMMTEKQRNLLISLINQKIVDVEERENRLEAIESGYSKSDAHEAISELLSCHAI
jgi:hypothetical protein